MWRTDPDRKAWKQQQEFNQRQYRKNPQAPRVVMLPVESIAVDSCRLRCWNVADWLRRNGWRVTVLPAAFSRENRQDIISREHAQALIFFGGVGPHDDPSMYGDLPVVLDLDLPRYLADRWRAQLENMATMASACVASSEHIAAWFRKFNARTQVIWTTTPEPKKRPRPRPADRKPVVAWTATGVDSDAHDLQLVCEASKKLVERRPFELWLSAATLTREQKRELKQAGVRARLLPAMTFDERVATWRRAAVGLQVSGPEQGKLFNNALTCLAADAACVVSYASEHRQFFRDGENGRVAAGLEQWVDAIDELLSDAGRRSTLVDAARQDYLKRLTTPAAGEHLDHLLRRVIREHFR